MPDSRPVKVVRVGSRAEVERPADRPETPRPLRVLPLRGHDVRRARSPCDNLSGYEMLGRAILPFQSEIA